MTPVNLMNIKWPTSASTVFPKVRDLGFPGPWRESSWTCTPSKRRWTLLVEKVLKNDKIVIFIIYIVLFILLIGLVRIKLNLNTNIFTYFENYPYFGSVFRLQGFNTHPNMLANILIISNLFLFYSIKRDGKYNCHKIMAILLSSFFLFLTFSKSLNIYFILQKSSLGNSFSKSVNL